MFVFFIIKALINCKTIRNKSCSRKNKPLNNLITSLSISKPLLPKKKTHHFHFAYLQTPIYLSLAMMLSFTKHTFIYFHNRTFSTNSDTLF